MLTDLSWLEVGQYFPPECERPRLERYAQNKLIFENEHGIVYKDQFKRLEKVLACFAEVISYPIELNFQKKISLKTADFLFGEQPDITAADKDKNAATKKNAIITEIGEKSGLMASGYEGAIDCSRFGTTVLKIDVEDNKGVINITGPEFIYAVVEEGNRKKIKYWVFGWKNDTAKRLTVYIHEKGKYTRRVYECVDGLIKKLIDEIKDQPTGLDDFAIIPIHNVTTSDRVFGIDDYMDVDSIVSELEVRTAQISKILDIFANPTPSGSAEALVEDENGEHTFEAGNYYARENKDTPELEYVVWDASLDSNFKQIENLLKFLSVISEMGAAILNADFEAGNIPSGSALRKLYINVLAKVARMRNSFDVGLKKAIALASQVGYSQRLQPSDISITWHDGLPIDPKEIAEIIASRTGNKATLSQESALVQYDGMSPEAAQVEIEKVRMDEMAENGMLNPSTLDDAEDDIE